MRYEKYHKQLKKKSADISILFLWVPCFGRKHVSGASEEVVLTQTSLSSHLLSLQTRNDVA